jgi:hypothetical protein
MASTLHTDEETATARTGFPEGGNLTILQIGRKKGSFLLYPCWISRHYNQKEKSSKLVYKQTANGFHKFVTILYPHQGREETELATRELEVRDTRNNLLSPELVTGLAIRRNNRSEVAVFSHQGPESYQFAGTHMAGEVMLIRREADSDDRAFIVKV